MFSLKLDFYLQIYLPKTNETMLLNKTIAVIIRDPEIIVNVLSQSRSYCIEEKTDEYSTKVCYSNMYYKMQKRCEHD